MKKCKLCGISFDNSMNSLQSYCSQKCVWESQKKKRIGKKNPNFKHGCYSRKTGILRKGSPKERLHLNACAKYRNAFLKQHSIRFCEVCGTLMSIKFSVHHIYFASLYPRHENLHNPKNLVHVCAECHAGFHTHKKKAEFLKLEKERGLKELFS